MAMNVTLYGLTTCAHCKNAKAFLDDCGAEYEAVFVDMISGDKRNDIMRKIRAVNPEFQFPTIFVDDAVFIGFKKDELKKALAENMH